MFVFITLELKVFSVESKCTLLLLAKVIVTFLIWRRFVRKFAVKSYSSVLEKTSQPLKSSFKDISAAVSKPLLTSALEHSRLDF